MSLSLEVYTRRNGVTTNHYEDVSQITVRRRIGGRIAPDTSGSPHNTAEVTLRAVSDPTVTSREPNPAVPSDWWPMTRDDSVVIRKNGARVFQGFATSVASGGRVAFSSDTYWHYRRLFRPARVNTLRKLGAGLEQAGSLSADWVALSILRDSGFATTPLPTDDVFLSAPMQQSMYSDLHTTQGARASSAADKHAEFTAVPLGYAVIDGTAWYVPRQVTSGNCLWAGVWLPVQSGPGSVTITYFFGEMHWRFNIAANTDGTRQARAVLYNTSTGAEQGSALVYIPATTTGDLISAAVGYGSMTVYVGDRYGNSTTVGSAAWSGEMQTNLGSSPYQATVTTNDVVRVAGVMGGNKTAGAAAYAKHVSNLDVRLLGPGSISTAVAATPTIQAPALDTLTEIAEAACRIHGPLDDGGGWRWWDSAVAYNQQPKSGAVLTTDQTALAQWSSDLDKQPFFVEIQQDTAAISGSDSKGLVLTEVLGGKYGVTTDSAVVECPGDTAWIVDPTDEAARPSYVVQRASDSTWAGYAQVSTLLRGQKYMVALSTTTAGDVDKVELRGSCRVTWTQGNYGAGGGPISGSVLTHNAGPWVGDLGYNSLQSWLMRVMQDGYFRIESLAVDPSVTINPGEVWDLDQRGVGGVGLRVRCLVEEVEHTEETSEDGTHTETQTISLIVLAPMPDPNGTWAAVDAANRDETWASVDSAEQGRTWDAVDYQPPLT